MTPVFGECPRKLSAALSGRPVFGHGYVKASDVVETSETKHMRVTAAHSPLRINHLYTPAYPMLSSPTTDDD